MSARSILATEYLVYEFRIEEPGDYDLRLRVAANKKGREIKVVLFPPNSGAPLSKTIAVPNDGWDGFNDIFWNDVHLAQKGHFKLQVYFVSGQTNICSVAVYPTRHRPRQPHPSPTPHPTRAPVKAPSKAPAHPPAKPPEKRYPPITWPALDYDYAEDKDPENYKGNCYNHDRDHGVDAQVTSDKVCIERDHAYCNIAYTEPGGKNIAAKRRKKAT